ncbi:reverse transcriptase/maturase family protein [Companilactobacillus hulinensis]|uniref:reverse transcriptase/maturase family protein n=1 Tax=Companilactobacillus hulinensis TaxID=2486007 RepID=UPI000F79C619|nr:reverse transcriptase/maturase family protein [Companilactobacillus hulinensis]
MVKSQFFKTKMYAHFDPVISYSKVKSRVESPKWVSEHGFFPLIHYVKDTSKWFKEKNHKGILKPKSREIYYASHIDGYIYKYYADILSNRYNEFAINTGIDDCSIAYRTNKIHQNNISYSREVFSYIASNDDCLIIRGDFSSFFDNINHSELLSNLKKVLHVKWLPKDWMQVMRSLYRCDFIEKDDIELTLGKDKFCEINSSKSEPFFNPEEFRDFKRKHIRHGIEGSPDNMGIPQGTPISAVLANVSMIEFDKEIQSYIFPLNGMYRRYSDDFILAIPLDGKTNGTVSNIRKTITDTAQNLGLKLNDKKTEILKYSDNKLTDFSSGENSRLDYLGFVFDGKTISIRKRSITKFYRKAYKEIDKGLNKQIKKGYTQFPGRKKFVKNYVAIYPQTHGKSKTTNFVNYVHRSNKEFLGIENVDIFMNAEIRKSAHNFNKRLIDGLDKI